MKKLEPIIIQAYQCPSCNKVSRTITGIKLHMKTCYKIDRKMCRRCRHFYSDDNTDPYRCELEHEISRTETDCKDFEKIKNRIQLNI